MPYPYDYWDWDPMDFDDDPDPDSPDSYSEWREHPSLTPAERNPSLCRR